MDSPKNPILATKKPRSQRSRRHRGIQPRRARTRQLSSHAKNKILARQKGRLKFRRPLFLIRFLLKILQQPQPFRVRHIRKAALIRAGLPSLRGCQGRFRNIRDGLLRQPILLAQGFQVCRCVSKLKIINHTNPLLSISSGAFPCFACFFCNSGRVFDLLQCGAVRLGNQPPVKHAVGNL